ncbi:NAD(P)-dependent alcohol dehydrogenase [Staphylococcus caprae]|mgnify:FL=1|uniref:NAD(P)-dependent alcohol dehydrogenase n=1 Tax=Staphylococcus caprae TaxID=29380 RepID=UPI00066B06FE|nr:NAD(P)-dependent alcohol dehydrogenase [Staphylococcus caprae]QJE25842.1 NAD(P)-dependent alcohol dehydrogenase [Staphylococcus caprae]
MKTNAFVTTEENPFSYQTIVLDEPNADEVLVKVIATGVCHTDSAVIGNVMPTPKPAVLGHEGAGIVEKVGEHVTHVKEGDHVVLGFTYCGECKNCLDGNAGACENFVALNLLGRNQKNETPLHTEDGEDISQFFGQSSFSNYVTANEKNIVKVDDEVDLRYLGPLGCGFMTGSGAVFNSLQPKPGSSFIVFGVGTVGLSAIMAAKLSNCYPIIAVDIFDSRLDLAMELGATHTINSKEQDVVEKVHEINGAGVNYAFETTGVPDVILSALRSLAVKGECATVAVNDKEVSLNVTNDIMRNALTLKGVLEGDAMPQLLIPELVQFFKRGQYPMDKMVKFYQPDEIGQAFEDSRTGNTIKPIVVFDASFQ